MNRTIKFRAWDGSMMRTSFVVHNVHGLPMIHVLGNLQNQEQWKLMQFTGLTDKNGTEIYEGDVVRIEKDRNSGDWAVEYVENGMMFCFTKSVGDLDAKSLRLPPKRMDRLASPSYIEVIGNIYENPELLSV